MTLARQALVQEGVPADSVLVVSVYRRRKVIRVALEGPYNAGRTGAHWYSSHHALARLLSCVTRATVHGYVYDPQEYEEVISYGAGRHVGGERLVYGEVELPEGPDGQFDDAVFERMQASWPLGHLACIFGMERESLLQLHKVPEVRLRLNEAESEAPLERLLPDVAA